MPVGGSSEGGRGGEAFALGHRVGAGGRGQARLGGVQRRDTPENPLEIFFADFFATPPAARKPDMVLGVRLAGGMHLEIGPGAVHSRSL